MSRLALAALVAAILLPASAHAATKTVIAGPPKTAKGVIGGRASGDIDGFSLRTVTIHVGDRVRWKFNGFHTVTFPKRHGGDIPLIIPDPSGAKYAGINDAAGSPFWFNGLGQLILNPQGAFPQGGKVENGSAVTGSGLPQGNGAPKPYTLRFTRVGVFHYECVVHAGMEGTVKVVRKGKRIPSARQDRRTAAKLFAKEVRTAKKHQTLRLPANTVQAGNDAGRVVQLRFFPRTVHLPVGGTLTLQVKSRPEIHTFAFGPASYLMNLANAFVVPTPNPAGPPTLVFNAQVGFPSDPPPAIPSYDGTSHGNGFLSTGVLDGDPNTPNPSTAKIKFTKAGTYGFICLIHPFMHGEVVVGP